MNVKLSNSQLNNLKSRIKNGTEVSESFIECCNVLIMKITNNKLLITNKQVSKIDKAFANGSSANIKLSKIQLHKTVQSGGFLGRILGSLLKTWLPLIGNVLKPLAKTVLIPLGLSAASATDTAIHKKMFGCGCSLDLASRTTTLIILNEEMNDTKIVKPF